MRSVSGTYRMDAVAAAYFGSDTIKLLARDVRVIGRFARRGTIRGTLSGRRVDAFWNDARREGWMTLNFDADYSTCTCSYGPSGGPAAGQGRFVRTIHTRRSRARAS